MRKFKENLPPAPPNPFDREPYINDYEQPFNYEMNNVSLDEVTELKQASKRHIKNVKAKNLFSLPSMITILFFLLSTVYIDLDAALMDGYINRREGLKLVYLLFGGIATLVARESEGDVYTPHGIPGHNKEDFDMDGIPNELDDTPYG